MANSDRPPRNERDGERSEAAEGRSEPGTDVREGRESRNDRRPRRDNPDRHPATSVNGDGANLANGVAMAGDRPEVVRAENAHGMAANGEPPSARNDGAEGREKRSRDRYGRERGPRGARDGGEERQDRPLREQQQPLEGFAPAPVSLEVGIVAPIPALAAAVAVLPTPVATAGVPAGLPKVQPFVLPMDELAQVAESSGLRWINSDAGKISAVQGAIAAQPAAIHVPRERQVLPVVDEGPLVLVETKRDLRNMTLPFEQTAS